MTKYKDSVLFDKGLTERKTMSDSNFLTQTSQTIYVCYSKLCEKFEVLCKAKYWLREPGFRFPGWVMHYCTITVVLYTCFILMTN